MDMIQTDLVQQLCAESVSDNGKAYKCSRCGLWVRDFDFDPEMGICMTYWKYILRD